MFPRCRFRNKIFEVYLITSNEPFKSGKTRKSVCGLLLTQMAVLARLERKKTMAEMFTHVGIALLI